MLISSAHKLPVETGRYSNVPYDKIICQHCYFTKVGNEKHYLMRCNNTTGLLISERIYLVKFMDKITRFVLLVVMICLCMLLQ